MKRLFPFVIFLLGTSFISFSQSYIISTVAGNNSYGYGYSGNGGPATNAEFFEPTAVAIDQHNNFYISDFGNSVIRKVDNLGIITTVAGNHSIGYSGDGGLAINAAFNGPCDLLIDSIGNMYIADQYNEVIRKVNTSGIISTIAGIGTIAGYSGNGGYATNAELDLPTGIWVDKSGNLFIAEQENHVIRKVNTSGIIITIAGNGYSHGNPAGGYSGDGGAATLAELNEPVGVIVDLSGNIYISDQGNRVRKVNASDSIINTVVGNGINGYSGDGAPATDAEIYIPSQFAFDSIGNLYIACWYDNAIRMVSTSGIITTIAGNGFGTGGGGGYSGDGGPATAAELFLPFEFIFDKYGNAYIGDEGNEVIRKLTPSISTSIEPEKEILNISIFPNPTTGIFTIQSSVISGKLLVEIFNVLGQKIYSQFAVVNSPFSIDLSNQPNGVYLYRILRENGNPLGEGKIVIER